MPPGESLPLAVLASGRGSNFQALQDACARGAIAARVAAVISDNPRAPALERARAQGVPAVVVERKDYPSRAAFDTALADAALAAGARLVCLAGFMRVLSPVFLERFGGMVINIHPSLLPAFPGLDAQKQALDYGVKVAGCTVHFVDAGVDTGPIILQACVPVAPDDTVETLSARILEQEHRLYPKAVDLIAAGKAAPPAAGRVARVTAP